MLGCLSERIRKSTNDRVLVLNVHVDIVLYNVQAGDATILIETVIFFHFKDFDENKDYWIARQHY